MSLLVSQHIYLVLLVLVWPWPAQAVSEQQHVRTSVQQHAATPDPPGQLIFAQVVFRHGARTPLSDLYWPHTEWTHCNQSHPGSVEISLYDAFGGRHPPAIMDGDTAPVLQGGCHMGLLTDNGYNMAVDLGRRLHQRYVQQHKLLPPTYSAAFLQAETTASSRTVLTLQGVLSGMYPATVETVPVACRTPEKEIMLGSNSTCAALGPMTEALLQQQAAAVDSDPQLQQLAQYVSHALGLPKEQPFSWGRLRDMLTCMAAEGKHVPNRSKHLLPLIDEMATRLKVQVTAPTPSDCLKLGSRTDCDAVVRLTIGQLLHDILSKLDAAAGTGLESRTNIKRNRKLLTGAAAAAAGDSQQVQMELQKDQSYQQHSSSSSRSGTQPKLVLSSAHDTTLIPLLTALGQQQTHWPAFTSSLAFELWQHDSSYHVQVLHDGVPLRLFKLTAAAADTAADIARSSSTSRTQATTGSSSSSSSSSSDSSSSMSSSSNWVHLAGFKQQLQRYVISREAHDAACQEPRVTTVWH